MATFKVVLESVKVSAPELAAVVAPIIRRVHGRLDRRIVDITRTRTAPLGRTGRLRAQIREDPSYFSGPLTMLGGVTSHAPYSRMVHGGTKSPIVPVRASVLSFIWPKAGNRRVFFMSVRGHAPVPFLTRAAHEAVAEDPHIAKGR